MCGIIGYVGKKKQSLGLLISGLERLEYRGYDSAGLAYIDNHNINIIKKEGKVKALKELINFNDEAIMGIAHTRWATHGKPSEINSHPHQVGKMTIVHNGIIENYSELKKMLIKKGYHFQSETDTEIGCALLDYLYSCNNNMKESINEFKKQVRGTYALGIINSDNLNTLYAIKKDSPLIIGVDNDRQFIASDMAAILKYTNKFIILEDGDSAIITSDKIIITDNNNKNVERECHVSCQELEDIDKLHYQHYMLKEINEEPIVIEKTINQYLGNSLNDLIKNMPDFSKYNHFHIVACGSAYYAGLVGKNLIESIANIPVDVEVASEYRYKKLFLDEKTLVIFISQSGETADTLAAVKRVKELHVDTLGVINVVNSSIARTVDYVLYTKAGSEIAVATTKAYSTQLAVLALIALNIAHTKTLLTAEEELIIKDIRMLPKLIDNMLMLDKLYQDIALELYQNNDIFFIGRGIDYALAYEGALKLKEISYLHSEAYAAGELKHGTISLIDDNVPVIALVTNEVLAEKTISNIKEVKARGAKVILITTDNNDADFYDYKIVIPDIHQLLKPILSVIPLQLIAYEVAKLRKCDIDKPRNLAKSVTVE